MGLHKIDWRIVVPLTIGLACLNVYPDLIGHGPAFVDSAAAIQPLTNGRVFFSMGLGTCGFLFALLPRRLAQADGVLLPVIPFAGALSAVAYASIGKASTPEHIAIGVLCAFCVGFCYGWFLVRLLGMLAQSRDIATIVGVAAVSLLLKTLMDNLFALLAPPMQIGATAVTPIAMAACVALLLRASDRASASIDLAELPKCGPSDTSIMLILLVMNAILHAVTRALSTLGFWGESYVIAGGTSFSIIAISAVLLTLAYFTLIKNSEGGALTRFLPAFLVLLAGFFILDPQVAALLGVSTEVLDALTTTVELFAHLIYWTIIVTAVRSLDLHPYRVIGLTVAIMCMTAVVLSLFLQQISETNRVVVMVAMYFFIFIVIMLFKGSKDSRNISLAPEAVVGEENARLFRIAESYRLSPRETEVFVLLAQGRDRAFIQNELFISDATIKTHTQHIYAKLNVHSKQELISFARDER